MPYKDNSVPKRKKKWVGRVRRNGAPPCQHFATKKEAEQWEAEVIRNLKERSISPDGQTGPVSFQQWCNAYLDYSEAKHSSAHYKAIVRTFTRLARWQDNTIQVQRSSLKRNDGATTVFWAGDLVTVFTPHLFTRYLTYVHRTYSSGGANNDRTILMTAWNWGVKVLGMPWQNPLLCTEERSMVKKEVHIPTIEELRVLYASMIDPQDRVMLMTYFLTSARKSELFRLKWQDVDIRHERLRLFCMKNKKGEMRSTWLKMPPPLLKALQEQQERTGEHEYVFINPKTNAPYAERSKWIVHASAKAGLPKFSYHGIRHLSASLLACKNVPLKEIQLHLRHAQLSTTEIYVHDLKERIDGKVDANHALADIFSAMFPLDFKPKLDDMQEPAFEGIKKGNSSAKIISLFKTR